MATMVAIAKQVAGGGGEQQKHQRKQQRKQPQKHQWLRRQGMLRAAGGRHASS
jgi:hypothetical protein